MSIAVAEAFALGRTAMALLFAVVSFMASANLYPSPPHSAKITSL